MKLYTPHVKSGKASLGHLKTGVKSFKMPKAGKVKMSIKSPKMSKVKIKI